MTLRAWTRAQFLAILINVGAGVLSAKGTSPLSIAQPQFMAFKIFQGLLFLVSDESFASTTAKMLHDSWN